MNVTWWSLIGTIIAAAAGGGTVASLINYFQNRPKLTAEAEDIYSRKASRERREGLREHRRMKEETRLVEYKFDRLLEACTSILDAVQNCPGANVSAARAEILEIKYLDRIPGRQAPSEYLEEEDSD